MSGFMSLALHSEAPWKGCCWNCSLSAGGCFWRWEPTEMHGLPWLSTHLGWLWWFCSGTSGMLAVLLHSGCSHFSSHIVSLHSGPVCVLGLPYGHSGADWTARAEPRGAAVEAFPVFTWSCCQLCSSCSPRSMFPFFHFISSRAGTLQGCTLWEQSFPLSSEVLSLPDFLEILDLPLTASATTTGTLLCLSLSCAGSLPSSVSLFHFLSSFHFYCLFFSFSSFSFLSEKHCCCMCMFQTSFQCY